MSNPRNNGTVIGRLANDPKVFTNKDGSKKVLFTLMVDRNYTDAQNERQSDAIDVEAFVRAQTKDLGPYSNVHKGDLVAVGFVLRKDVYSRNGQTVYELKVVSEDITYLEPKSVTHARLNERVKAAEEQNKALQGPTPQPVAVVQVSAAHDEQLPFGEPPF